MALLIVMVGLPGAGKTTRARQIEVTRAAVRLSPDPWLLGLFGDQCTPAQRDAMEGHLLQIARRCLAVGTNVIVDFGCWARVERDGLRYLASSMGARSELVYLPISAREQWRRVQRRYEAAPAEDFPLSKSEVDEGRRMFEVPDEQELAGAWSRCPPPGYDGWPDWLVHRWPGCSAE